MSDPNPGKFVKCPECKQRIKASQSFAEGTRFACPVCKKQVVFQADETAVPRILDEGELFDTKDSGKIEASSETTPPKESNVIVWAVGVLLLLFAGSGVTFWVAGWFQGDQPPRVEVPDPKPEPEPKPEPKPPRGEPDPLPAVDNFERKVPFPLPVGPREDRTMTSLAYSTMCQRHPDRIPRLANTVIRLTGQVRGMEYDRETQIGTLLLSGRLRNNSVRVSLRKGVKPWDYVRVFGNVDVRGRVAKNPKDGSLHDAELVEDPRSAPPRFTAKHLAQAVAEAAGAPGLGDWVVVRGTVKEVQTEQLGNNLRVLGLVLDTESDRSVVGMFAESELAPGPFVVGKKVTLFGKVANLGAAVVLDQAIAASVEK